MYLHNQTCDSSSSRTPRRWSRSRTSWRGQQQRASWVEPLLRNPERGGRKNAGRIRENHLRADRHPRPATTARREMSWTRPKLRFLLQDKMDREVRTDGRKEGRRERGGGPKDERPRPNDDPNNRPPGRKTSGEQRANSSPGYTPGGDEPGRSRVSRSR